MFRTYPLLAAVDYPRTWNLYDNGAMVNVAPILLPMTGRLR